MKKIILLSILVISRLVLLADEGMWLPLLLKQLNEKEMQKMGMKITADEIYSVNHSSMKDAVVLFGRGCTGELISSEGLLLTNHHCGFGQIQDHSSLEHDYLQNGFWAMNRAEELPNPGLTVTFIVRMEDVTSKVLANVTSSMSEKERDEAVAAASLSIVQAAVLGTHYEALIKPMYNGNEFMLFVTEVFRDVRLVGAPPQSIGNFGKDSDNWVWPRHTADFSMFRIYADKDNKPADYSPDNVPFKPRHHFPISLSGVKENDFTMVYGFPARTNEYLTSFAVEQIVNLNNPRKVDLRGKRLDIMNKYMAADRGVFIKYADKYSGVSNYHKKWAGEAKGLKRANAIERKQEFEVMFQDRVKANSKFAAYAGLMQEFKAEYDQLKDVQHELDLYSEGILTIEIFRYARGFKELLADGLDLNSDKAKELIAAQKSRAVAYFKDYYADIDRETLTAMMQSYYMMSNHPLETEAIHGLGKFSSANEWKGLADVIFSSSSFDNETEILQILDHLDADAVAKLKSDPAFQLAQLYFDYYSSTILKEYNGIMERLIPLNRTYVQAQREVIPEKKYYPDANQSLRVAYGKIEGYRPADATVYTWYTTADGILEKNRSGNPDYEIPSRLKTLIETRDYGQYGNKQGELRTCFAASNHTTGGNSGSPVLNAKGQLIGTNFDRNWEGTMSDVYYDINQVRNIVVDVRYTLFIIDKFAGARHLVEEMTIVK